MKTLARLIFAITLPLVALAGNPEAVESEIVAMEGAFNEAYATNQVDTYFSFYTEDATLFFYGERQPVALYRKDWHDTINAGSAVVRNDVSDM